MSVAICWFRRDLRLADSHILSAALAHAAHVIPVYVLDPVLLERYVGTKRVAFLLGSLRELDAALRARGSRLIVRRGDAPQEIARLVSESSADAVYAEEDFTPYARQRDAAVTKVVPLQLVGGSVYRVPGTVLKADGSPYAVFTPFSRRWKAFAPPRTSELLPMPGRISTPDATQSVSIPTDPSLQTQVPFPPGEAEAQRRLRAFTTGASPPIDRYAASRDRMDLEGTSRLSPYLRFGMLSTRQAIVAAYEAMASAPDEEARHGAETWLNELIWREFYMAILYHYPYVLEQSYRSDLRSIHWDNDKDVFAAWCDGQTGYPVVDAAMRQLVQSGWMHNRARMIAASFLIKDLLIDWRWGERHFMQHLVDGDPSANNGGWQWTAGTGTDAAPYFRVFNPILQGKRYDPQGAYVRRWVPELTYVPDRYIHTPWEMDPEKQRDCGCLIGVDYPAPIVDHAWARDRALAAYRVARDGSGGGKN